MLTILLEQLPAAFHQDFTHLHHQLALKDQGVSGAFGVGPEACPILRFTNVCRRSRPGKFTIHVRTMRKRLRRSLKRASA